MSEKSQRCLTIEELVAYGNQELASTRAAHLNECSLCKAALDGLELADSSLQQELRDGTFLKEYAGPYHSKEIVAKERKLISKKWLIAASILLGIGWAAWQYYPTSTTLQAFDNSPLAYVEQPYRRQMRSAGITTDMYGEAAHAFALDSFSNSVELYLLAIPNAPTSLLRTRGYYELGITYWQKGEHTEAIDYLTRARLGELDYYEDATWALAQLYRQLGFLDEAKSLYQDLLSIEKSPYRPKALELIAIINSADSSL